ncbi:MAG TPA: sulfite exporter TauE/SafE family protein [Candidatus Eisenbacteria bacterium]|nr:sulfite exporter TauE/SafE family protein [Candidatus Eisenbacteria bacterium]
MLQAAGFVLFGFVVGVYGTLVGAGGGFLVVPFLLLVKHFDAAQAAGTSLVVVFLNALSGTIAYARQKRIDYKSGLWFAGAALPGSLLGAYGVNFLSQRSFHIAVGALLSMVAGILLVRPHGALAGAQARAARQTGGLLPVERRLVDAEGRVFEYRYDRFVGLVLSFFVGFLSSLLGIGGGIIHVPALVLLLAFPAHISTATSHFILAITAAMGAASHAALGHVQFGPALAMGAGAVVGAPLGAKLSQRTGGAWILRGLAIALLVVGIRLFFH